MKKKIKYEDAPKHIDEAIKRSVRIEDFLPSPEEIKYKEKNLKVTINLSQKSIEAFKKKSEKVGIPYQRMIKAVLDAYAESKL